MYDVHLLCVCMLLLVYMSTSMYILGTANDANLRSEAVEAMNVLLKNSARDTTEVVRSTLQVVLSQLEQSFSSQILTAEDREKVQGLQSLLCGSLQVRDPWKLGGIMALIG